MTINDFKRAMAFYNVTERRRRHDVIDTVPLSAENLLVNVLLHKFKRLIVSSRFLLKRM